jgi:hypothetical protein
MTDSDGMRWQPGDAVVVRYVETPESIRMLHAVMGDSIAPSASNPYPFLVDGEIVTVRRASVPCRL